MVGCQLCAKEADELLHARTASLQCRLHLKDSEQLMAQQSDGCLLGQHDEWESDRVTESRA